jgi:4-amino-4-deoxy-L-arabinose transferase-like glycosyltransferase
MTRPAQFAIIISIVAVTARLILIDQPYIDNWSWRQSDVAAIARNYFQGGFHFVQPQIDWAGDQAGYVGTEFPILPFLAAVCYKIFGLHEWVGRVQAVLLFAVSLPFFFLLVRKIFGDIAAIWALFFYCFAPLGVMASRCFMPDIPSLALSIIGLYFFQRWLEEGSRGLLLVSVICVSLSILIKVTSVVIAVPLFCLAFQRFRLSVFQRLILWLFGVVALLPSALWYWHAYQISLHFYPYHFFGAGGVRIMSASWYLKIAREIATSELTPLLFVIGCFGASVTRSMPRAGMFHWWLAVMILFVIIVGYGNRHLWYQLPLIPIMAAFAGSVCAFPATRMSNRSVMIAFSSAVVVVFGFSAFLYVRQFYQPSAAPMRDAGLELKKITGSSDLLVAADNGDPTIFYYAERKGWHFLEKDGIYNGEPRDSAQAIVDLEGLRQRGASYLVFTSNTAWWLDYHRVLREYVESTSALVAATAEFKIYKLNPVSK